MNDHITVVSGSARSGTSLLMRMLDAGGIPAYADGRVTFESARVAESMKAGHRARWGWLEEARGHCIKILEPLHISPFPALPDMRFILMRRNTLEQTRSVAKLFYVMGDHKIADTLSDPTHQHIHADSIARDWPKMLEKLETRGPVMVVDFEHVLQMPVLVADQIDAFCKWQPALDVQAMTNVVIPRGPLCYPGMLELQYLADTKGANDGR